MKYTHEELERKNFAELRQIGYELNVLPEGDRRCRQTWIDAIAGVNPPLLQLLEVSPGVEVDRAQEPIIETAETSPAASVEPVQDAPRESKFGRIVYPKSAAKPISQNEEARPQLDRVQSADVHNRGSHPTKSDRDSSGAKTEALGSQEGDRVLAVARHCETGRGRVLPDQSTKLVNFTEADLLENEPRMSQSAIAPAAKNFPAIPTFQVGDLVQSKTMVWGLERKSMTGTVLELLPRGGVRVQFGDHISGYGGSFDFSKSQREDLIPVQEPIKPIDDFVNTSQRQEPIVQAAETSPGVEVDQRQEPIEYGKITGYLCRTGYWCRHVEIEVKCPRCGANPGLFSTKDYYDRPIIHCRECDYGRVKSYPGAIQIVREMIVRVAEVFPGVGFDRAAITALKASIFELVPESPDPVLFRLAIPFSTAWHAYQDRYPGGRYRDGRHKINTKIFLGLPEIPGGSRVEVDPVQNLIMGTVETSPGVDLVEDEVPECSTCFGDGYIEDEFGFVKFCQCETRLSHQRTQRAIAQSVEKSPGVDCVYCHSPEYESLRDESYRCYKCEPEPDQNPILTGVAFSDRFLATYPPYFGEIRYKAEVTGQLNLLEPVTDDELPDPDDFESLDAFREAIARWDGEHPSSLDHFSDHLPSSEDNALGLPLDSFCLWAHCPADWYEPTALLDLSKVSELSPTCKSSITSDFFIPTFGTLGDRDEPPDTGIFARLPKPKPPKFPPQAATWAQVEHKLCPTWTPVIPIS
jgi:hypothetical protein